MSQKEKWIGRSRRWQAAIITMLSGLVGFGVIPEDAVDPIRAFFDTLTSDSGLIVAGLQTWAGFALVLSYFFPDNAKVKLVPKPPPAAAAALVLLPLLLVAGCLVACASDFGPAAFMRGDAMRENIVCEGDCRVTLNDSGISVVETKAPSSKVIYRYTAGGQMSPQARALAAQVLFLGQQAAAAYAGVPPGMVTPPPAVPAPSLTADQVRAIVTEQLEEFTAPAPAKEPETAPAAAPEAKPAPPPDQDPLSPDLNE